MDGSLLGSTRRPHLHLIHPLRADPTLRARISTPAMPCGERGPCECDDPDRCEGPRAPSLPTGYRESLLFLALVGAVCTILGGVAWWP